MHYKVLFLSMSCNDPFFEISRKVVEDTWAKDIINGKYPGIGYYSYTSSSYDMDYINGNTIYINVSDNIEDTYEKTIKVFEVLRDNGITFDYIIRTNTSVYFNIPLILGMLDKNKGIDLMGPMLFNINFDMKEYSMIIGNMMFLSRRVVDSLVDNYNVYNKNNVILSEGVNPYDDVLISIFSQILINDINIRIIDNKDICFYKPILNNKYIYIEDIDEVKKFIKCHNYTFDPNCVLYNPFIKVRLNGIDTKHRYIELEHMYELDKVYRDYVIV